MLIICSNPKLCTEKMAPGKNLAAPEPNSKGSNDSIDDLLVLLLWGPQAAVCLSEKLVVTASQVRWWSDVACGHAKSTTLLRNMARNGNDRGYHINRDRTVTVETVSCDRCLLVHRAPSNSLKLWGSQGSRAGEPYHPQKFPPPAPPPLRMHRTDYHVHGWDDWDWSVIREGRP